MKIFITGATGFVGLNLVDYYVNRGHEVYSYQRGQSLIETLILSQMLLLIQLLKFTIRWR